MSHVTAALGGVPNIWLTITPTALRMHKIALEAIPDPELAYSTPVHPETGFVGGGSYMACVIDQVGHRRAISNRMPATQDQHNATNAALLTDDQGDSWPAIAGDDTIRDRSQSLAAETAELPSIPTVTNDGGKVKKLRRATSSLSNPISRSAASGRRRGLSSGGSTLPAAVNGTASRGMWVQDAGDSAVWTIASIGEGVF